MSLITVSNISLVSTTPESDAFAVLECFIGVKDTAEEFLTGVDDTRNAFFGSVNDTAEFRLRSVNVTDRTYRILNLSVEPV